jgi:hypothetical protein
LDPLTEIGPVPGNSPYITADSMLIYCETRMRQIDLGIHEKFDKQVRDNDTSEAIHEAEDVLKNSVAGGWDESNHAGCDVLGGLQKAINTAGGPDTPTGRQLKSLQISVAKAMAGDDSKFAQCFADQNSDGFRQFFGPGNDGKSDADMIKLVGGTPANITREQVTSFSTTLDEYAKDLSSGAELDMIDLQAVMSQRQTAIQLPTNLLQAMSESTNKIVGNIHG